MGNNNERLIMTKELTITQDLTIRQHLATLAKSLRAKYSNTAYQGDYVDTVTDTTLGDRLQVGTTATINGTRYLIVLNVLIARKAGGQVSVRISTWKIDSTGELVGHWTLRRTDLTRVRLTAQGFIGCDDITARIAPFMVTTKTLLKVGLEGNKVQLVHTDRNGANPYDTGEQHLLAFGGYDGAYARLSK